MSDLIVISGVILSAASMVFFGFVVIILSRSLNSARENLAEMSKEIRLTQAVRNDPGSGRIQSAESRGPSARVVNEIARLTAARKKLTEPSTAASGPVDTASAMFRRRMRNPDSQGGTVDHDSHTGPAPIQTQG